MIEIFLLNGFRIWQSEEVDPSCNIYCAYLPETAVTTHRIHIFVHFQLIYLLINENMIGFM